MKFGIGQFYENVLGYFNFSLPRKILTALSYNDVLMLLRSWALTNIFWALAVSIIPRIYPHVGNIKLDFFRQKWKTEAPDSLFYP